MTRIKQFLAAPLPLWFVIFLILMPRVEVVVDWPLLWEQLHCYPTETEPDACDLNTLKSKT